MNIIRTDTRTVQLYRDVSFKDEVATHTIDYNPWTDDNGAVSSVELTVKSGQGAISNESLASNIKTFVLTTAQVGRTIIQAKATAGNNIDIITIDIFTKDPNSYTEDYGICL